MDFEKIVNGKTYNLMDWFWRLFVLNVLTILTSIGIVTILPSLTASFKTIKDYKEGNNESIFKLYFNNFKIVFKKSFWVGLLCLAFFGLLGYAIFYYMVILDAQIFTLGAMGVISYIGFYVVLFCFLILLLITFQMPMTLTYFNFRYRDNYKFAFFMAFRFIVKSLLILSCWLISGIIFLYLTPAWFFYGLTLPLYMIYTISRPVYWYLANNKSDVQIIDEEMNEDK